MCDFDFNSDWWTWYCLNHHIVYVVIKNEDNFEKYDAVTGCI